MFELASSGDGSADDEILEGELFELLLCQTRVLDFVIDGEGIRVGSIRVLLGTASIPLIVQSLEVLEALCPGVVRLAV